MTKPSDRRRRSRRCWAALAEIFRARPPSPAPARRRRARSGPRCSGRSRSINGARAARFVQAGKLRTAVDLYLRAKLGSCNCTTGVADDGDLDLA